MKIDGLRVEAGAGIEQMQRARQRLDMQPVGSRDAAKKVQGDSASPSRNGLISPSNAATGSLPRSKAKIG